MLQTSPSVTYFEFIRRDSLLTSSILPLTAADTSTASFSKAPVNEISSALAKIPDIRSTWPGFGLPWSFEAFYS